jgi:hypothetical protein
MFSLRSFISVEASVSAEVIPGHALVSHQRSSTVILRAFGTSDAPGVHKIIENWVANNAFVIRDAHVINDAIVVIGAKELFVLQVTQCY